jgi:hypothetical protein
LITYIADTLQTDLRPRYHVLMGERVYVAQPSQNLYPDVAWVRHPAQRETVEGGGIAVTEPDAPTAVGECLNKAQRQPFIEIVHAGSGEVVTAIEVLSPSNKVGAGLASHFRPLLRQRRLRRFH